MDDLVELKYVLCELKKFLDEVLHIEKYGSILDRN